MLSNIKHKIYRKINDVIYHSEVVQMLIQSNEKNINLRNTLKDGKDYSLHSGERQIGNSLCDIRADHRNRYELVNNYIKSKKMDLCLDIFCGNGYGSFMLANQNSDMFVLGIDGSNEAIEAANANFSLENNLFSSKLYPFTLPHETFDLITCFESLEHVKEDECFIGMMIKALKHGGLLFLSVPHEKKHSLTKNPNKFHFKHYLNSDIEKIVSENNLKIINMYGQDTYQIGDDGYKISKDGSSLLPSDEMYLRENYEGQILIYILQRV